MFIHYTDQQPTFIHYIDQQLIFIHHIDKQSMFIHYIDKQQCLFITLINNECLFITLINNQKFIYYIDFTIPSLFIVRTLIRPNKISKFNKFRYLSELLVTWVHKTTECAEGHVKQAG